MKLKHFSVQLFILGGLLFFYCSASKKYYQEAALLENSGMYEEAAEKYYSSILEDLDNIEAKVGLKRTAQKVVDKRIEKINQQYKSRSYLSVYKGIIELEKDEERYEEAGIRLDIPSSVKTMFTNSKSELAEAHYKKGLSSQDSKKWSSANKEYELTLKYMHDYKDTKDRIQQVTKAKNYEMAVNSYERGVLLYNARKYKEAYYAFQSCYQLEPSYENVRSLMNESLEKGKIRIGIFPFKNSTRVYNAEKTLYAYIVSNAVKYPSKFIEVIDRNNLERLLYEQRLGLSGIVDELSAANAGKVLGLNAVVLGNLIEVSKLYGNPSKTPINVFELYYNSSKQLRGKEVTYYVYEATSSVTFKAQYQIIDTETGRIVSSDIESSSDQDYVKYAKYSGNINNLSIYDPRVTGKDGTGIVRYFFGDIDKSLFSARSNLKSPEEMADNIIENLASSMANKICRYFD